MKLKYEFSFMDIDGDQIAVPVGMESEFHGILRMNGSTKAILELLKNDITEEEIVSSLLEVYDADEPVIRDSVEHVISKLRKENLLED